MGKRMRRVKDGEELKAKRNKMKKIRRNGRRKEVKDVKMAMKTGHKNRMRR